MQWLAAIAVALWVAANAEAANVQARLIRASNEAGKADAELQKLVPQLKKQFGFQNYQQLGFQKNELAPQKHIRMDLGQGFVVLVAEKKSEKKEHELEVEWFSCKTSLVKSVIKAPPGGQVFIKGPEVGKDWIILSLSVQK